VQTLFLADGRNLVATAGQNFMGIGLMAYVPNQMVERGVVDVVHGDSQLYDAETGRKVAARLAHAVQQVLAQLVTELR
jgi:hypothetical protein